MNALKYSRKAIWPNWTIAAPVTRSSLPTRACRWSWRAAALAKASLAYARENSLEVVPLCPFVRSYIERKPEYQDLVSKASTGGFA